LAIFCVSQVINWSLVLKDSWLKLTEV